jgi:hypothetical protein
MLCEESDNRQVPNSHQWNRFEASMLRDLGRRLAQGEIARDAISRVGQKAGEHRRLCVSNCTFIRGRLRGTPVRGLFVRMTEQYRSATSSISLSNAP